MFFRKKKKIGLALGSGGAKGLAHIGVIKTLINNNIPIDFIAGSSAGALIGGLYACLKDINKVEQIFNNLELHDLITLLSDPLLKNGLIKGDKAQYFLKQTIGDINIENLTVPFSAVATNIMTGESYIFNKGSLALAIRTSGSIPFLFKPVEKDGDILIDGGVSLPVPCEVVKEMGANIIIAVNLSSYCPEKIDNKKLSASLILKHSFDLIRYHLAKENCKNANAIISPHTDFFAESNLTKFINGQNIIAAGQQATEIIIPLLKSIINK